MITAQEKGYLITYNVEDKQWVYVDTNEPTKDNPRPCKRCGKLSTQEGYDSCLGKLPGVINACCGHGSEEGYIMFENGVIIRSYFKVERKEVKIK